MKKSIAPEFAYSSSSYFILEWKIKDDPGEQLRRVENRVSGLM